MGEVLGSYGLIAGPVRAANKTEEARLLVDANVFYLALRKKLHRLHVRTTNPLNSVV